MLEERQEGRAEQERRDGAEIFGSKKMLRQHPGVEKIVPGDGTQSVAEVAVARREGEVVGPVGVGWQKDKHAEEEPGGPGGRRQRDPRAGGPAPGCRPSAGPSRRDRAPCPPCTGALARRTPRREPNAP